MLESILIGLGCLLLILLIFIIKNNFKRIYLSIESIRDSSKELCKTAEDINNNIIEEEENIDKLSNELSNISKELKSRTIEQNNYSIPINRDLDKNITKKEPTKSTDLKPGERLLFTKDIKLSPNKKFIEVDLEGNEVKYSTVNKKEDLPKEILEQLKGKKTLDYKDTILGSGIQEEKIVNMNNTIKNKKDNKENSKENIKEENIKNNIEINDNIIDNKKIKEKRKSSYKKSIKNRKETYKIVIKKKEN